VLLAHGQLSGWSSAWRAPAAIISLAFIALALTSGRRYRSAVWVIPSVALFSIPILFPWYFVLGLPYALARRNVLAHLLVGLPLVDQLARFEFTSALTLLVAYPLLVIALCRPPISPPAKAHPT
jgi:hypothetical protein